jgi:uncharacterized membrane protein
MRLNLELQVPDDTASGEYEIPVTVTAGNSTLHERVATITVEDPTTTLSISNDTDAPGNPVTVQYNLQNRESTTVEDVEIDVGDLPAGWTIEQASFDQDTRGNWNQTTTSATGTLKPFDRDNYYDSERQDLMYLNLKLNIPDDAADGEYDIPVTVRAGESVLHKRAAVVTVEQSNTTVSTATTRRYPEPKKY